MYYDAKYGGTSRDLISTEEIMEKLFTRSYSKIVRYDISEVFDFKQYCSKLSNILIDFHEDIVTVDEK